MADVVLRVTRGVLYRTGAEAVHIIVMRGAEVRCEGPLWDRSDLWVGAGWVCAVRLALAKGSYFEGFRPSGSVAREFDCSDPSVRRKIVFPDCVNLMGKCQACTISRCDLHRSAICLIDMRL